MTEKKAAARAAPPDLAGFTKLLDAVENAAYRFERIDSNANRDKLDAHRAALLSAISSLARERDEARGAIHKARRERDASRAYAAQTRTQVASAEAAAARLKERVGALAASWLEAADLRQTMGIEARAEYERGRQFGYATALANTAAEARAALRAESDEGKPCIDPACPYAGFPHVTPCPPPVDTPLWREVAEVRRRRAESAPPATEDR